MPIAALLASIALYVPVPAGVTVQVGQCPGYEVAVSCADTQGRVVYLLPDDDRANLRFTLAHELGHIWDADHMTDPYRAAFTAQTGAPDRAWFSDADTSLDPGEAFANAYAYCSMSPRARRREFRDDGNGYPGIGIRYQGRAGRQVVANTCWLLDHPPTSRM